MVLVVGIGNTVRRDDGAGWIFAEALAAELAHAGVGVTLELQHQLSPEVALSAAELQSFAIFYVDASAAVASPVITRLVEDAGSSAASHHLSPVTCLAILDKLYGVQVEGWLVQTPAEDFGHGEGLSEMAKRGVDEAAAMGATLC